MTSRHYLVLVLALTAAAPLCLSGCPGPGPYSSLGTFAEVETPLKDRRTTQGFDGTRQIDYLHRIMVSRRQSEPSGYRRYVYVVMDRSHTEQQRLAICEQLLTFFRGVHASGGPHPDRSALLVVGVQTLAGVRRVASADTAAEGARALINAYDYDAAGRLRERASGFFEGRDRDRVRRSAAALLISDQPLRHGEQDPTILEVVDLEPSAVWELQQRFQQLASDLKAPPGRSAGELLSSFVRSLGAILICWAWDQSRCSG